VNALANGAGGRVEQRCGTAGEVLAPGERFSVIVADPPYVPSAEVGLYPEDPVGAIDGGPDGLGVLRSVVNEVVDHLAPGGSMLLQVRGAGQVDDLAGWLAHPSSPALVVAEARSCGELRAVARLAHGSSLHSGSNPARRVENSS